MQKYLVLGSNSFSGSHFVRHLLEHDNEVLGVSRSKEPHDLFLPYKWLSSGLERFHFERIDLNHDLDHLIKLIQDQKPEYIVNFAAQGMVAQSWETPEDWYQTNVVAQVKLHDRLRKLDFLKKYVHVSTPEVYGSTEGLVKENFNFTPSTPYAVSRAACDMHLMSFFRAYDFPVVFTRSANVYGPGQQLYRIIPRAMLFAKTGKKLQLHGGGQSIRSFIHIEDVAAATRKIALSGIPGKTYHISTESTVSIKDLVNCICEMTGKSFEDLAEVTEDRLGKDQVYLLDTTWLREELAWKDQIGLEQGLVETLSWIEDNVIQLKQLPQNYQHSA
jgi:dTDP-glucose 4,6-dehydratase